MTRFCEISPRKSLQVFVDFMSAYFLFGKRLSLLWQICDIIGLIFIVANGQILNKNLIIWSHCLLLFSTLNIFLIERVHPVSVIYARIRYCRRRRRLRRRRISKTASRNHYLFICYYFGVISPAHDLPHHQEAFRDAIDRKNFIKKS